VTDGVTEARNPAGALYGSARVEALLPGIVHGSASARDVVEALRADVEGFVAGAEPSDDLTILALRWQGPRPAG
jgi:serine phosphatase RsbU (regulator of sigma subunit)